jgi:hypothetical protein
MTLAPRASVTLGSKRYDSHGVEVDAELAVLPGVSSFTVRLPSAATVDAAPGDSGSLELDGGEGAAKVLSGTVHAVRRTLAGTSVTVADAGAALWALRPAATYTGQGADAVIRALASDASADVGSLDLTLALAAYVAAQERSAAEQIATLARLAGTLATVNEDGKLDVGPVPPLAGMALKHGREVLACEVVATEEPPPRIPIGAGASGSAQAPGALRPSNDPLPSSAPAAGASAVHVPAAVLRTASLASSASRAAQDEASASASRVRARCVLLPAVRPGTVVDIQDLPGPAAGGPWVVTSVQHRLRAGRPAVTRFEARAASAGAGGLAGAAAGAIGGLL